MGNAGESAEECMASFCEFELGYGHVAVQVVSRDNPTKFKEQYEVHVSDRLFLIVYVARTATHTSLYELVPLSSRNILKKLTLCETLDIRIRITGTVSGTFWSTTSRDNALGVISIAYVDKYRPSQGRQSNMQRLQPTTRYETFNLGV